MRTTLDLPDGLARRAKLAAVRRGVRLRELVAQALEHELAGGERRTKPNAATLPVISSRRPGSYDLKPSEIADILLREEAAAYEIADRR